MWCGVVWCGVVWCGVVWCGVVWCGVVWCGVVRACLCVYMSVYALLYNGHYLELSWVTLIAVWLCY